MISCLSTRQIGADTVNSPENVGLVDFMASLKRVDKALIKLTSSNMRANQQLIGDYNELLNEGSVELQSMFHNLLAPDAHPVEPLHYITKRRCILPNVSYYPYNQQSYRFPQSLGTRLQI